MNNGFSTGEEDSRGPTDQICCLIDENERCRNAAGNASYSKRIQKTVTTRRLKLNIDPQVRPHSHTFRSLFMCYVLVVVFFFCCLSIFTLKCDFYYWVFGLVFVLVSECHKLMHEFHLTGSSYLHL